MGKPVLKRKFGREYYHLFDYGYANIFKARGEAVRLRAKGYKVRVVKTKNSISIYRKK